MALKGLKAGKPAARDINVTPFIDVVLVLLIIFMVITPIMVHEMSVSLPDKTETVETEDLPKDQLLAAVCLDGTITLNRTPVAIEDLKDTLHKRLRSKAKKIVFVDAHPDAGYNDVVQVLDIARDAGADRLGLASLKSEEDFRACTARVAEGEAAAEGAEAPAP
jgi:biopolymer transport protein ExbD